MARSELVSAQYAYYLLDATVKSIITFLFGDIFANSTAFG
jgi:hypothetical protein